MAGWFRQAGAALSGICRAGRAMTVAVPGRRGKLRALGGLGLVTVGVLLVMYRRADPRTDRGTAPPFVHRIEVGDLPRSKDVDVDKVSPAKLDDEDKEEREMAVGGEAQPFDNTVYITVATSYTLQNLELGDTHFRHCTNLDEEMACSYQPYNAKNYNRSEAVLFRGLHFSDKDKIPDYRPFGQKWIFLETQPPVKMWDEYRSKLNIWSDFNITATYTTDAQIFFSMYNFKCKKSENWKPNTFNFGERKSKINKVPVVWFGTNCKDSVRKYNSKREKYIEELKKYIKIDTDTSCGTGFQCGQYDSVRDKCLTDAMGRYKFYLAFERYFCDDYYTQKILKSVATDVIPVVMGMANYNKLLTPGTFIDVRTFGSPKKLAEYLEYLSKNHTAYNEYVQRKMQVKCGYMARFSFHCKLCRYLHVQRGKLQSAPDIRQFWGMEQRCESPEQFFKGIANELVPQNNTRLKKKSKKKEK